MMEIGPILIMGSNTRGAHGGGAAAWAAKHYGAKMGVGNGLTGNSYALPTKDHNIRTLDLDSIQEYVEEFLKYAKYRSDLFFMMTKIGCGLAGLHEIDILPMFGKNIPENIDFPLDWNVLLNRQPASFYLFEKLSPIDQICRRRYNTLPTSNSGFKAQINGKEHQYSYDTDRSRTQQIHEFHRLIAPTLLDKVILDPEQDGITHINIYSKGKTKLGRFLSNFAHTPVGTEDGDFASIEGYWYWLLSQNHPDKEQLRSLYGSKAKVVGKELYDDDSFDWTVNADNKAKFIHKIMNAIELKVHGALAYENGELITSSNLPFAHYYLYGDKVVEPQTNKWIVDLMEALRREVKERNFIYE